MLPDVAYQMRKLFGIHPPRKFGLAVSGGVDSMALTGLIAGWAALRQIALKVFIVDHKLRHNSSEEAVQVKKYINERFKIPSQILTLNLTPSSNVEEMAREARRRSLEAACIEDNVENLLMGHHLNDQIELFIQRLLAGSTWFGLAGMQFASPIKMSYPAGKPALKLIRPLLEIPKSELKNWCLANNVQWWEDPTNNDIFLTQRNLIRRLYEDESQLPEAFRSTNVIEMLKLFGTQRQNVQETAGLAMRQLSLTRQLVSNQSLKRSSLTLSKELQQLPSAILSEVILRIIAPLSPKSDDTVLKKRGKIHDVVEQIKQGTNMDANVLGVQIKFKDNVINFKREVPRREELMDSLAHLDVYQATKEWSDYTLIDNRWYMRWRLTQEGDPKYFSIGFLSNSSLIVKLTKDLPEWKLEQVKNDLMSSPFLMWSDPASPLSINIHKIIGFPTLKLVRGLEVQTIPKVCRF